MKNLYIDGPDRRGEYEVRVAITGWLVQYGFESAEDAQGWIDSRAHYNGRDCPHFDTGKA